ncbi:MAG: hypothetical protein KDM81_16335, partial [Verrucomicrobiae bacterium]|nr:hypothetical protein [Verrucomicrobiae bacterium]
MVRISLNHDGNRLRARRNLAGGRAIACCLSLCAGFVWGADFEDAERLLRQGDYTGAVVMAESSLAERPYSLQWPVYLIEGLSNLGRYAEARTVLTNALAGESRSIALRWSGREVYRQLGDQAAANRMTDEIIDLVASRPWSYRDASDLVYFGRAALARGADPKDVLDRVYAKTKQLDPQARGPYLAGGELALDKGDYALAPKQFQEGLERLPGDPDLHLGLARAFAPSDPSLMMASVQAALKVNPNHIPSLLLLADYAVDAEDYPEAERLTDHARSVNPYHPETWAYRAVLAHLQNQPGREQAAMEMALKFWTNNPAVPHLVGRKLSQKYRFAEGAERQRQALAFQPDFLPAKEQLAQDLLRLGQETEGWRLAEEVHQADGYDVAAMNLVTLKDAMAKYHTLTNEHFVVRMVPRE